MMQYVGQNQDQHLRCGRQFTLQRHGNLHLLRPRPPSQRQGRHQYRTYLYNALEQRLEKAGPTAIVPTGANYYVYDLQGQIIGEYNATNKVISETVYLGATPVALIKQTIAGSTTTTTANYIYADQIDTPRVITRASDNKMVWRWDQADPFGLAGVNESAGVRGF